MSEKEVIERLDVIIGLLAIQGKERKPQLRILRGLGFTSKKISQLTGIHETNVRKMWG